MRLRILAFLVLGAVLPAARAHDGAPTYDRINLSASAAAEIDNDRLVATLYAEHQAQSQSEATRRVNEAMGWAAQRYRGADGVSAQTTGYRTFPVYANQTLTGWRTRQSLRLSSADTDRLGDLIAELQERLAIESVRATLSGEDLAACFDPDRLLGSVDAIISRALAES